MPEVMENKYRLEKNGLSVKKTKTALNSTFPD
jgi:hypothetical protein